MSFWKKITPNSTSKWFSVFTFSTAIVIGMGLFIAKEANLFSYLSDDPKTCVNCHVMNPVYNSWMHSSHREYASCNDCHVPHNNVFNKYFFKAKDGLYHSYVFTTRQEPEVIFMREASQEVVQNNCIRCHVQQVTQTKYANWVDTHTENRTDRQCWSCHKEVPHGSIHGLSTIRNNISPLPTDKEEMVIPSWLEQEMKEKGN